MSKVFIMISMIVSFHLAALANTVESAYLQNSILPQELKGMILDALQAKCPEAISPYGLSEVETVVRSGDFQGKPYRFYTTNFRSRYYSDGMHPATLNITVYSADRSGTFDTGRIVSDLCEQ